MFKMHNRRDLKRKFFKSEVKFTVDMTETKIMFHTSTHARTHL